jgi:4'-phosphopantetheinyl transferase
VIASLPIAAGRATARPMPDGDRVVVRLVDLTLDGPALAGAQAVLTPGELARARRGTGPVHRRRVGLRAALRSLLGDELGMPPAAVPLAAGPAGQPVLAPTGRAPWLHVSCSASGDLGLVALGRGRRIGVDVEAVVPWSADVLDERWLDPEERRALVALPEVHRPLATARAWTQKEAVLKARGTGLREDPAAIRTPLGRPDGVVAGWRVREVPVPGGWVASLALGPAERRPS